jgi:hypothetical protein
LFDHRLEINSTSELIISSNAGATLNVANDLSFNSLNRVELRDFNLINQGQVSLSAPNVSITTCQISSESTWLVSNFSTLTIHGSTLHLASSVLLESSSLFLTQINHEAIEVASSITVSLSTINVTTHTFMSVDGGFNGPDKFSVIDVQFIDGIVFYYGNFKELSISDDSVFQFPQNSITLQNAVIAFNPANILERVEIRDSSFEGIGAVAWIFDSLSTKITVGSMILERLTMTAAPVSHRQIGLVETSLVNVSKVVSNRMLGVFEFGPRSSFVWIPFVVTDSYFGALSANPAIGFISGTASSGFDVCLTNVDFAPVARSAIDVVVDVSGNIGINFTCSSQVRLIYFVQSTTLIGTLEVTGRLDGAPAAILSVPTGQGQLRLQSIVSDLHIVAKADTFTYLPTLPDLGILNSVPIEAENWRIEWPLLPVLPEILKYYPFYNIEAGASLNTTTQSDSLWNITYTLNDTNIRYDFGIVPCNPACYLNHTDDSALCINKVICHCLAEWAGPVCECDQLHAPLDSFCDPAGGLNWLHNGDLHVQDIQFMEILPAYTLTVDGNVYIDGNVTMGETTSLVASGVVISNGTLKGLCKLKELRTSQGCIIYSTLNIQSLNMEFSNLSLIQLEFDVSDLTTDGSCVPPTPPDAMDSLVPSTFASLERTLMASSAQWTFTMDGGKNPANPQVLDKLSFSTRILTSGNRQTSEGTTSNLRTSTASSGSCSSAVNPVGAMTLFVSPCESPGTPAAKSTGVKWYVYTIPIIAVVVIAAVIATLVFTVPAVRNVVLPYHKS